jgi:hypothetical protein
MRFSGLVSVGIVSLGVLSCGSNQETAAAPAAPASAPSAAAASAPAPSAEPDAPPRKQRPLEIASACADVVTVVFGEDPKAPKGSRTIAPSASIDGPRETDGTQTVWLLDSGGVPLIKVHVTRGMKRVDVGRSCRTLDAR